MVTVGSGFLSKTDARAYRDDKKGEIRKGLYNTVGPSRKTTVAGLMALVVADYRRNNQELEDALRHEKFWNEEAGKTLAHSITGNTLLAWADKWLKAGLTQATVNRRIRPLLRGYRLALDSQPRLVAQVPAWHDLKESAPRSGFVEQDIYQQLRAALPRYAQIPVTVGFWTAMRIGEILTLSWPQLTFNHQEKTVRLLLGGSLTKNGEPRQVIMPGELYETLAAWQRETKRDYPLCRWVCHRRGVQIGSIHKIWQSVCVQLGLATGERVKKDGHFRNYQGLIVHDLRRSGLRNLIRAGVDRDTAKAISGHKSDDVFSRYNIVNEEDLAQAGTRVVAFMAGKQIPSEKSSLKVHFSG